MAEHMATDFDTAFGASFEAWSGQQASRPRQIPAEDRDRHVREDRASPPAQGQRLPHSVCVPSQPLSSDAVSEAGQRHWPPQAVPVPQQEVRPPDHGAADSCTPAPSGRRVLPSDRLVSQLGDAHPQPVREKGKKCGQPALLSEGDISQTLNWLEASSQFPARDRSIFLLPVRAGLRPCEVSGLLTRTLVTASGDLLDHIIVMPGTAKRGKERHVPMHQQLREELLRFLEEYPNAERIAFCTGRNGRDSYLSAGAVSEWFRRLYAQVGLAGCSAMSGRHTFADGLYRLGAPVSQIKQLLGHARLQTTQIYLRPREIPAGTIDRLGQSG